MWYTGLLKQSQYIWPAVGKQGNHISKAIYVIESNTTPKHKNSYKVLHLELTRWKQLLRLGTKYICSLTFRDPILTEQELALWEAGGAVLEQTGDEGQSPQEQPNEISPHE